MRKLVAMVVLAATLSTPAGAATTKIRIGAKCSPVGRQAGPQTVKGAVCTNKTGTLKWENAGDAVVRWAESYGITSGRRKIIEFAQVWCNLWAANPGDAEDNEYYQEILRLLAERYGWSVADVEDTGDSAWLAICPSAAASWWSP